MMAGFSAEIYGKNIDWNSVNQKPRCRRCNGNKAIPSREGKPFVWHYVVCPVCNGSGEE